MTRRMTGRPAAAAVVLAAAGVAFTSGTAHADGPIRWSVTGHQAPPSSSWTVSDHRAQKIAHPSRPAGDRQQTSRAAFRHRIAGHRHRRTPVSTWTPATTCQPAASRQGRDHRVWLVGPGDTLWLIARCHPGVTQDQIRARNGIRGDLIRAGQVLFIPPVRVQAVS